MKILGTLALIIIALILHTTLFDLIAIGGVRPDLLLIILVLLSLRGGSITGTLVGFIIGFFQDLYSPEMFGLNALTKSIVGYLLGLNKDRVYWGSFPVQAQIIFFSVLFHDFAYFLIYSFYSVSTFLRFMLVQALPTALYSAVIGPVVYKLFGLIGRVERDNGSRVISVK
ncbi:rod shape-determining protein MreD [candidate division KSB1 bacterium]